MNMKQWYWTKSKHQQCLSSPSGSSDSAWRWLRFIQQPEEVGHFSISAGADCNAPPLSASFLYPLLGKRNPICITPLSCFEFHLPFSLHIQLSIAKTLSRPKTIKRYWTLVQSFQMAWDVYSGVTAATENSENKGSWKQWMFSIKKKMMTLTMSWLHTMVSGFSLTACIKQHLLSNPPQANLRLQHRNPTSSHAGIKEANVFDCWPIGLSDKPPHTGSTG